MIIRNRLLAIILAGCFAQLSFGASNSDRTWFNAASEMPLYMKNNTTWDITVSYKTKMPRKDEKSHKRTKWQDRQKFIKSGTIEKLTDNVTEMFKEIDIQWHSALQSAGLLSITTGDKVAGALYPDTQIQLDEEPIFPFEEYGKKAYLLILSTGWTGGANFKIDPYDP